MQPRVVIVIMHINRMNAGVAKKKIHPEFSVCGTKNNDNSCEYVDEAQNMELSFMKDILLYTRQRPF